MTNNKIWAIVPAAGSGQRMGMEIPKQYLETNGKTILEITLSKLLENKNIDQIVVCTASDDFHWSKLEVSKHPKIQQTNGGLSRALSVLSGLISIVNSVEDDDWVLVHDAARPCLSQELLDKLINELSKDKVGGILAVPAKDTLKLSNNSGESINKTLDRSLVWHAQTPQMFRFGLLKDALQNAIDIGLEITDEASAMEHAGHAVKLVEGDSFNLKITTKDDLALASYFLVNR